MKKQILSIAIIAILPFGAYADPAVSVGPAAVPSNGTAVVATANPPYQTLTPTNDDKQHIASTAYVKGAYNDSIAAVNKVADMVEDLTDYVTGDFNDLVADKQNKLTSMTGNEISTDVLSGADYHDLGQNLANLQDDEEFEAFYDDIANYIGEDLDDVLISAGTTMYLIRGAAGTAESNANNELNRKRVEIYTTWDNDNAKKQVAFVNASAQSGQ